MVLARTQAEMIGGPAASLPPRQPPRSGRLPLGMLLLGVGLLAPAWPALVRPQPAAASEHAQASSWLTSYEEALAVAQRTGRPVLTVFTGSDWCPHCKTLEENVLFTETFREWADDHVVLLMIDLPQAGISQAVRSERSQVCIKYGVRTFPSVLVIGPDGSKLASQTGYAGQSAAAWIGAIAEKMPASTAQTASVRPAINQGLAASAAPVVGEDAGMVCESLDDAVEKSRGTKRPILLVVSRPGDKKATTHTASLINHPEFAPFVHDHFVVAQVPPEAPSGSETAQSMENLLGGVELPSEAVELIVTEDGQTPLFSQSGGQPPARIVNGLRRFLAARQAARFGEASRR